MSSRAALALLFVALTIPALAGAGAAQPYPGDLLQCTAGRVGGIPHTYGGLWRVTPGGQLTTIALGKPIASSDDFPIIGELEQVTDGDKNAADGSYVDMFKAGIIDPLKVVRTALENAASIAALMLTTETLVTDLEKDDNGTATEGAVR